MSLWPGDEDFGKTPFRPCVSFAYLGEGGEGGVAGVAGDRGDAAARALSAAMQVRAMAFEVSREG